MFDWDTYLLALGWNALIAVVAWLLSIGLRNVGIVDSLWSLMILAPVAICLWIGDTLSDRGWLVLVLVSAWAIRLSAHITLRNHGQAEDYRYQAIRANNQPYFRLKSLYIVFGLQAFLAWIVAAPAVAAAGSAKSLGLLDAVAVAFWTVGMFFEVVGDWQLARFQRARGSSNAVLDRGLWRYTRHPNYFGEALIWWGIYLFALSAGFWWTVFSPLLMTLLLLRVSGVALLEKDIAERRPAYRAYVKRTSAFFPAPPRAADARGAINGA